MLTDYVGQMALWMPQGDRERVPYRQASGAVGIAATSSILCTQLEPTRCAPSAGHLSAVHSVIPACHAMCGYRILLAPGSVLTSPPTTKQIGMLISEANANLRSAYNSMSLSQREIKTRIGA